MTAVGMANLFPQYYSVIVVFVARRASRIVNKSIASASNGL
jgi:hypothetical protein